MATNSRVVKKESVPVVYYLSRNGQLEHPHFIQVPISSSQGLFLKDVMSRLNSLRGEGMAEMYSWSSKRTYRNGYVWQDLTGNDLIHPCHGQEYILKGSPLLLETSLSFGSSSTSSSSMLSSISSDTTNGSGSFRAIHVSTQTEEAEPEKKVVLSGRDSDSSSGGGGGRSSGDIRDRTAENERPSGRFKAADVLMQLISCGSLRYPA